METETRGQGQFPISNLAYDLMTVIYQKSQGLEAYDKYMQDAQSNQQAAGIFQQIRQQDTQFIQQLTQCLQQVLSGSAVGSGSGTSSQ